MRIILYILLFSICTQAQIILNPDRSKLFNPVTSALETPTDFTATGNTDGTHTLDATLTGDSVLVWVQTNDNREFAYSRGYIEDTLVYPVGDFPLSLTGKYFNEKWYYKLAVKNSTDTSAWTALDSAWVSNASGDTTYYAAVGVGDESGSSSANAKEFTASGFSSDLRGATAGDHLLLNRGDTLSEGNAIILMHGTMGGTAIANVVVGAYGTGSRPILNTTGGGVTECIRMYGKSISLSYEVPKIRYITFQDLEIRGSVDWHLQAGDTISYLKFKRINLNAGGTTRRVAFKGWANETNAVDYDSIVMAWVSHIEVSHSNLSSYNGGTSDDLMNPNGDAYWIHHDTLHTSSGDLMDIQYGDSTLIEYNLMYNSGAHGIKSMGQRGSADYRIIRFNDCFYVDRNGGGWFGLYFRTGRFSQIYNNRFPSLGYGFEVGSWIDWTDNGANLVDLGGGVYEAYRNEGNHFYNNIFYDSYDAGNYWHGTDGNVRFVYNGGDSVLVRWGLGTEPTGYFDYSDFEYNLFKYNSPYGSTVDAVNTRMYTAGRIDWTGTPGDEYDANSFGGDDFQYPEVEDFFPQDRNNIFRTFPSFVDSIYTSVSDPQNSRLNSNSPAIGAGIYAPVKYDLDGLDLIGRLTWDLGAYQEP